jgi:hypothetical protein
MMETIPHDHQVHGKCSRHGIGPPWNGVSVHGPSSDDLFGLLASLAVLAIPPTGDERVSLRIVPGPSVENLIVSGAVTLPFYSVRCWRG